MRFGFIVYDKKFDLKQWKDALNYAKEISKDFKVEVVMKTTGLDKLLGNDVEHYSVCATVTNGRIRYVY